MRPTTVLLLVIATAATAPVAPPLPIAAAWGAT